MEHLTNKELYNFRDRIIPDWLTGKSGVISADFDRVILIVGKVGMGKSSLALILAHIIAEQRNKIVGTDRPFVLEKQLYYDLDKLTYDVFHDSKAGDVRIVDEGATAGGYKRQAMSKENKKLNTALMTCRSKNQILFLLLPDLNDVDYALIRRSHNVIRIVNRGHAWIYKETEKAKFIRWNPKIKRLQFKQRPFFHLEKFRTVQKILGTREWEKYIEHKDSSLKHLWIKAPPKQTTQIKYRRPREVRDMFGIGKNYIQKLAKADSVDKIKDAQGWLFSLDSVKSYLELRGSKKSKGGHMVSNYAKETGERK